MPHLRDIRKRIEAARNIRKITQTMERISSVRVMRENRRLESTREYSTALRDMAADLFYTAMQSGDGIRDLCLLHDRDEARATALIVVASNQGMCGGFNNRLLEAADRVYAQYAGKGHIPLIFAVGKKAIEHFKNRGIPIHFSTEQLSERLDYEDIAPLVETLTRSMEAGELDEVLLIYTHLESSSVRHPVVEVLLPCSKFLEGLQSPDRRRHTLFECEPNVRGMIGALLPEVINNRMFQALLESVVAEHISRRVAMQQASTAAHDMIIQMGNLYQKTRKAKITAELNEIMSTIMALQRE
ncbi:MAG: ATP synthase F1 subunit gamma [bacterium]